ncbi:MAG: FAD-dependent oxidoreductase, partial [gamma proteobacterium symbiont of Phacoides pectinatus]
MNTDYEAIVIGSGPGGEGAAMKLNKAGKRVAIVGMHQQVGGGCTHWGTIPSKHGKSTLRQNSHYVAWRYASFSKYRIPPGY